MSDTGCAHPLSETSSAHLVSEAEWIASLDALESLVQRQRLFLAGAGPLPDSPWDPPTGELPPTLRVRAMSLAAACDAIEGDLRRMLHARTDRVASPYR